MGKTSYVSTKISGHDIVTKSSVFSHNSKLLLVPSGDTIRVYGTESGDLIRTLHLDISIPDEIVQIHLHPVQPDSRLVAFTGRGRLIVFDYSKGIEVSCLPLAPDLYERKSRLCFGQLFSHHENNVDKTLYYSIYFGTLGESRTIFYKKLKCLDVEHGQPVSKRRRTTTNTPAIDFSTINSKLDINLNITGVDTEDYKVAFGPNGSFIAVQYGQTLKALRLPASNQNVLVHMVKDTAMTCIVAHPTDEVVATGDVIGRIFLWSDFLDSQRPNKSILHWHHLPLTDLWFTRTGTYLYSVGRESTVVRWSMNASGERNLIPRLGMPLNHVTGDRAHKYVALSHCDNQIQVVNTDMMRDDHVVIESLTRSEHNQLAWSSSAKAIVLKGRPGEVQFYSPAKDKNLFTLDVVGQNYLPDEQNFKIYNTEIHKLAVSPDGLWLASNEMRDDKVTHITVRLKFWKFLGLESPQKFALVSTVHHAHKKAIAEMRFSPNGLVLVTTSEDNMFKVWTLNTRPAPAGQEPKQRWECSSVGYRNSVTFPSVLAFSVDSSLLSVVFDKTITFWDVSDPDVLALKEDVLTSDDSKTKQAVIGIEFGHGDCGHLFVEARSGMVRVWNLISLEVLWTWSPSSDIGHFVFDSLNNRMALFTAGLDVIVMDIRDKTPTLQIGACSSCPVVAGLFVPSETVDMTRLVFTDSRSELMAVLPANQVGLGLRSAVDLVEDIAVQTPFARLLIEKKRNELLLGTSDIREREISSFFDDEANTLKIVEEMFTTVPSHVLPPVDRICGRFLKALLIEDKAEADMSSGPLGAPKSHADWTELNADDSNSLSEDDAGGKGDQGDDVQIITVRDQFPDPEQFIHDEDMSWLDNPIHTETFKKLLKSK